MSAQRVRASSPPRVYLDANTPRVSTGTILTPTWDSRFEQRGSRNSLVVASTSSSSSRHGSMYDTQPVRKSIVSDPAHPGGVKSVTEYTVRPRKDSETRRPLGVITKNVSPTRDYVESPGSMVVYKQPRDDSSNRLLKPQVRASAHHQRHNSATRGEPGRHAQASGVPRVDRQYHHRGPYVEKVADSRPPPLPRYAEEPAYEYTGPREQFDRDYPIRTRRESLSRRERPTSTIDTKFDQVPFRRDTAPPPSASRALQRIEQEDRRSGFDSDPDRSHDSRRSRQSTRGPIVHQREDGYSSARDDYESRRRPTRLYNDDVAISGSKNRYHDANLERDRERPRREREREEERLRERERERERDRDRERPEKRSDRHGEREYERERERPRPRDYEVIEEDDSHRHRRRRDNRDNREESPERSTLKTIATAAVGGLAATGVANFGKSRKDEDDPSDSEIKKERRRRRRRSQDRKDGERPEDEDLEEHRRRRRERRAQRADSSGSDTPAEDASGRRPHSRTRQRRDTQDGYGSERERLGLTAAEPDGRPSREQDASVARGEPAREAPDRSKQESPADQEGRPLSPGEGEDNRPRRVSIVEPVKDKREEIKPKGILKPPRTDPFPEDANPIREGVAPLKQAGKDGIPTGARWTKVSRILVNPEALEKVHERFEERDDYVIVLRVLTREEIQKLAEITREIREAREREWQKQVQERRRRRAERGERGTDEDEDDYDDNSRGGQPPLLALEPPPSAPPVDLRQYAAQNAAQQQAQQAYEPQMAYTPQQRYPPQQPPQQAQQEQQWQMPLGQPQYQQQPQQQWGPGQWNNPGSARSSAEAIASTAPGQPLPSTQAQGQGQTLDSNVYSQNV